MAETKIVRNLSEIDAKVKELGESLNAAKERSAQFDKALQLNPNSISAASAKVKALRDAIESAKGKVDQLKARQKAMDDAMAAGLEVDANEYKRLQDQIKKATSEVKSLERQAQKADKQKLSNMQSGLNSIARTAKIAIASLAALATAFAIEGDEIDKSSKKLAMSATEYQRWSYIFDNATGSSSNFSAAMKGVINLTGQVAKESTKAQTALSLIGLGFDDLKGKGSEEAFDTIVAALAGIEDEEYRLSAATALLGDSGSYLAQIAGMEAQEIENLNAQFERNGYLSDEQVAKAADLSDKFTDLKATYKEVVAEIGTALAPAMKSIADLAISLAPAIEALATAFSNMGAGGQVAVLGGLAVIAMLPSLITGIGALKMSLDALSSNPAMMAVAALVAAGALFVTASAITAGISGATNQANSYNTNNYNSSDNSSVVINVEGNVSAEEIAEALAEAKRQRGY